MEKWKFLRPSHNIDMTTPKDSPVLMHIHTYLLKVKRGYFELRVIPYFSNISETTEAFELNVGGYNLL